MLHEKKEKKALLFSSLLRSFTYFSSDRRKPSGLMFSVFYSRVDVTIDVTIEYLSNLSLRQVLIFFVIQITQSSACAKYSFLLLYSADMSDLNASLLPLLSSFFLSLLSKFFYLILLLYSVNTSGLIASLLPFTEYKLFVLRQLSVTTSTSSSLRRTTKLT